MRFDGYADVIAVMLVDENAYHVDGFIWCVVVGNESMMLLCDNGDDCT